MNERLKQLRQQKHLSQQEFAEILNVSRSHIGGLEIGRKNLTNRLITDICREFSVNEEWLRYGTGEMFIDPVDSIDTDDDIKEMVRLYLSLDDNMKKTVKRFIQSSITEEKDRD